MSKYLDMDGLVHYTDKIKTGMDNIIQNGTKNLLRYDLDTLKYINSTSIGWTWNDNVATSLTGKTTCTIQDDMTIFVNTNNDTSGAFLRLTIELSNLLETGISYVLSGSTGGSNSTYGIYTGTSGVWDATNGPAIKTYDGSFNSLYIFIRAGQTFTNKIFYPMVCTEEIYKISKSYQPYAMTNYELTNNIATTTEIETMWTNS